jgi:hypothetical protein
MRAAFPAHLLVLNEESVKWLSASWMAEFRFPAVFFLLASPALRPTQPAIWWAPGAVAPGVRQPVLQSDHSPAFHAEV